MIIQIGIILACMCVTMATHAQVNYEFVTVGNPGNTNAETGFGEVNYSFKIGKYQVTIAQYSEFLNAIAQIDDTYALYDPAMEVAGNIAGILRGGTAGNYTYTAIGSPNRPIAFISWFRAARFSNWLSNGQPTGNQTNTTTENGAYALNGKVSGLAIPKNQINPNTGNPPLYYIPSENEWYKAAYYNPMLNERAGGYYLYATQSNIRPGNTIGNTPNQANYFTNADGFSITQSTTFFPTQNYLVDVGSYTASASFYGTYDQNGNLWEWNDLDGLSSLYRGLRGGAYFTTEPFIRSSYRILVTPENAAANSGFRLGSPE